MRTLSFYVKLITIEYPGPEIQKCTQCDKDYRTYVPGGPCELPAGCGIVCYDEPQLLCPECDDNSYGAFMNKDLFPNLFIGHNEEV